MVKITVGDLVGNLRDIGILSGDTLLIRGDMRRIGRVEGALGAVLLEALKSAVGPNGNIVGLSFSRAVFLPKIFSTPVFDRTVETTSGSLSKLLLKDSGSVRSLHPTNSFVAIGPDAKWLMDGHDSGSSCFYPMKKLCEINAKMIVFGCVDSSPGFTTVHWAQSLLGLSRKSILCYSSGILYSNHNNKRRIFIRKDIGGCSGGFGKLYSEYEKFRALRSGFVGKATALSISCQDALDVEMDVLKSKPTFPLCDDPDCLFCRGSLLYNLSDMPRYYYRKIMKIVRK